MSALSVGAVQACWTSAGRVLRSWDSLSWWRSRMKEPMPMPRWGVASGAEVKAQYGSDCRGKPLSGSLAVPTQLVAVVMG